MSDIEELISTAEFGDRVEALVQSDIGEYLEECAEQDAQEALEELMKLNPYDFSTLGELQSAIAGCQEKAHIARKILGYLGDAIIRGQQADQQLDED